MHCLINPYRIPGLAFPDRVTSTSLGDLLLHNSWMLTETIKHNWLLLVQLQQSFQLTGSAKTEGNKAGTSLSGHFSPSECGYCIFFAYQHPLMCNSSFTYWSYAQIYCFKERRQHSLLYYDLFTQLRPENTDQFLLSLKPKLCLSHNSFTQIPGIICPSFPLPY